MNLTQTCQAIIDGYAAEKCGFDDDMTHLLLELGDQAEYIIALEKAAGDKDDLELTMRDIITVLEDGQDWQEALRMANKAIQRLHPPPPPPLEQTAGQRRATGIYEARPRRPGELLEVGMIVVTLRGEEDSDPEGDERVTLPLSVGRIASHNNHDVWNLIFDFNGAWVCPSAEELMDPSQYVIYVKD